MADEYQYIKLPDGSYGKFSSDATDAQIKSAIQKDFGGSSHETLNAPPGGEGFPGVPNPIHGMIDRSEEDEAAKRLSGTGYNRMTSPLTPTQQERKLNEYNPGSQLLTAASLAPGAVRLPMMAIRNPLPLMRSLVGAGTVGAGGAYVGEKLGKPFGQTGEDVGGALGGALGTLAGGYLGARGMKIPSKFGWLSDIFSEPEAKPSPFGEAASSSASPGGKELTLPSERMGAAQPNVRFVSEFEAPSKPVDPVRQAVSEHRASWLPAKMTPTKPPEPELGSSENPGWVVKLPDRMPVKAPPEPIPQGKPSPFGAEATSSASPGGRDLQLQPARMGQPGPSARMVTKFEPEAKPTKATPIQREGEPLAVKGQTSRRAPARPEGRPATWTNERVREMAAWGDPQAIEQARLRGFGRIPLKYETAPLTPREKFTFSAEGKPKKVE